MRMILAVSAHENIVLRQFDVRTAFLNGELEEEVYVHPPFGKEYLAGRNSRVLRLRRALYGLKQALRAWNKRLEGELKAKAFEQSDTDPALWILHGKVGAVLAMFYVDDGLEVAKTVAEADALVDLVGSMFEIWRMGGPEDFLGIRTYSGERRAYRQVSTALPLLPMSVESFGRLGVPALTLLGDLADQAVQAGGPGLSRAAFISGALRELSVALCRGNASLCRSGAYVVTRAAGWTPMCGLARPSAEVV
jgi:hypothetical protein